ncbi:MAG: hypothetical protein Q8R28_09115 [Dehalococcoidia bacterium]|nr:hypothetical protein [Dehalococcoidia bacterium]
MDTAVTLTTLFLIVYALTEVWKTKVSDRHTGIVAVVAGFLVAFLAGQGLLQTVGVTLRWAWLEPLDIFLLGFAMAGGANILDLLKGLKRPQS